MTRSAAILCLGLGVAFDAAATTFSTDATDLWYAAPAESESGWGVNVVQQDDVLFVTMFVYGSNGFPTWYVGSNTAYSGTSGNTLVFTGPLYATSGGSPYSAPWNPSAFQMRQVGNVTFRLDSATSASITFTVDNQTITKNLVRQTWRVNDLSGQYIGAVAGTFSNCANPARNGFTLEYATIAVQHSGSTIEMDLANSEGAGSCAYRGNYTQAGRYGHINGTFQCGNDMAGMFTATEVEGGRNGISMRIRESSSTCNYTGLVGGVVSTP